MCVAKHQPHVLHGYGKIFQALFCEPYRVVYLCEIYIKPRPFGTFVSSKKYEKKVQMNFRSNKWIY